MKKKFNTLGHTVVIGALIAAPGSAFGIQMGGLGVSMGIAISLQQDDNITNRPNNEVAISSMTTTITPSVGLSLKKPWGDAYKLGYNARIVRYEDSTNDDHETQTVTASASYPVTQKSMASLNASYIDGMTPRGANYDAAGNPLTRASGLVPDEYHTTVVGARYQYGTRNHVYLSGGLSKQRFDNNEPTTRTSEADTANVKLGARIKPTDTTSLSASVTKRDTKYIIVVPFNNDRSDLTYSLGAGWKPLKFLRLAASVSEVSTDYEDTTRKDTTTTSSLAGFNLDINHSLTPKTTLRAGLGQNYHPASGDYEIQTTSRAYLGLGYRPITRVSTSVGVNYTTLAAKHINDPVSDKDQSGVSMTAEATYQMRSWLSFRLGHTTSTTTPKTGESTEKNVTGLTITASF